MLGRATAKRLAAQGASLAISDLNETEGNNLITELKATHPEQKFAFHRVDVTDAEAVDAHVKEASNLQDGGIGGLLCCAGIAPPGPRMHEVALDTYMRVMQVNLHGTYFYNSAVLREMVKQKSSGASTPQGGYSIVYVSNLLRRNSPY